MALATIGAIVLSPFTRGFGPLGQVFMYMAVITWTTAFAALARSGFVVLPHFSWRPDENLIGRRPLLPLEFEESEPGIKAGR